MKTRITLTVSLFLANIGFACRCGEVSIQDSIERCEAIFTGRVSKLSLELDASGRYEVIVCTFDKIAPLKLAPSNTTVMVRTGVDEPACGYEFKLGREYLIYARLEGQMLATSICERTKPLIQVRLKPGKEGGVASDYVVDDSGQKEAQKVSALLKKGPTRR